MSIEANHTRRLTGEESNMADVLVKMSDGNPGCLTFLLNLYENPNHGGELPIILLDIIGLYGEDGYVLWSDCCNRDINKTIQVLFNFKNGHLSREDILTNVQQIRGKPFENLKSLEEMGIT